MNDKNWRMLFKDPDNTTRAYPFWSWNGKLDKERLKEQIDIFEKMGYGGFHIHSRIGLSDTYLGEHFMDCVRFCHDYASSKGMYTYLYDEDKWPSGACGGRVTKAENNRARCLLLSKKKYEDGTQISGRSQPSRLTENGIASFLAAYYVQLDEQGRLSDYERVERGDIKANYYAYEIITDKLPWFNMEAYADLLNPEATQSFIKATHEKYREVLGGEFGKTVPAIFTDEPQHSMAHTLEYAKTDNENVIPYTDDIDAQFVEEYGYGLLDKLPEVFWNGISPISRVRWEYHNLITQRFADAYFGIIGKWCRDNGIMFSGHVMREDSLLSQTQCVGETMRLYPQFDLPGFDILAGRYEYNTAKQVQSVQHQYDKKGVICEYLGVTNWDYDFRGHKMQSEWLAALGMTVRVPHLAWMYMGGESKRDYPAPLDEHSAWFSRYRVIEDMMARTGVALRQGKPVVRIGVIHPIESYWAAYGPDDRTGKLRARLEKNFSQLTEWLLFDGFDFDFIAESLIPKQDIHAENGQLSVGSMTYDVILVPPLLTIRTTTLKILKEMTAHGGRVVILGKLPECIDAQFNAGVCVEGSEIIGFDRNALKDTLESVREVLIEDEKGLPTENMIYQLRQDGDEKWLFVAPGKPKDAAIKSYFRNLGSVPYISVTVNGILEAEVCETDTGLIRKVPVTHADGRTNVIVPCDRDDSALIHFSPRCPGDIHSLSVPEYSEPAYLRGEVRYRLHEQNVLLLDMAQYRLDGGTWREKEEMLRLDDEIRNTVGYRKRTDAFVQPWVNGDSNLTEHTVELRFEFDSEVTVENADFAYEPQAEIYFNGQEIDIRGMGHYLDPTIHRVRLGTIRAGHNTIIMRIPFGLRTNLENCYVLGDFGVCVSGENAKITALPDRIGFGPLYEMGFPFYGGNISYYADFTSRDMGGIAVTVPSFNAPLIDILLDGSQRQAVYRAPYRASFEGVKPGKHELELIAYGSRINQFGQIHNCDPDENYFGPNSWRSKDEAFSYAYRLKETGITSNPTVRKVITGKA